MFKEQRVRIIQGPSTKTNPSPGPVLLWTGLLLTWCAVATGCAKPPIHALPGETDYFVSEVIFEGEPELDYGPLEGKLSLRPSSLITLAMPYNAYRQAEDHRRILAYWHTYGYFDVDVADVKLDFHDTEKEVVVTWVVEEGTPYTISAVEVEGAPPELEAELVDMVPFDIGDDVDMETYRKIRLELSDHMRRAGYAHAETYSRSFVSREQKTVAWYFFIDHGPLTRVGNVTVEGSKKIPEELILERIGLETGEPFSLDDKQKAEYDLLDTGAFAVVHLETTADNEFLVGALPPDKGGVIPPERISDDGSIIPRQLSPDIDINVVVVEAPSARGRWGLGGAVDPTRFDAYTRLSATFPNLFGPQHHLHMEGLAGYGLLFGSETDELLGFYGNARLAYLRPGGLHRLLDWRIEARFEERLFPGPYHLRSLSAGPGFRISPVLGLFIDVDLLFRYEITDALGTVDAADRTALALPEDNERLLGEIAASVIYDQRNDPVESLSGYLFSFRTRYAPGSVLGNHSYLGLDAEGRYFIPLFGPVSMGLRARLGWVFDLGGDGVPIGARLFGGGSFDHRGFADSTLSPTASSCQSSDLNTCRSVPVGGLSTFGSTVEFRWLPPLKQFGLSLFLDGGSTSATFNPFADGFSLAVGAGLALRLWYVPLNIDFSYRVTDDPRFSALDRFFVFIRVGEAF